MNKPQSHQSHITDQSHGQKNDPLNLKKITVLGGGAWGTALAVMAAHKGHDVCLYARSSAVVDDINHNQLNSTYLPNIKLPPKIVATSNIKAALTHGKILLGVIPAQAFAGFLSDIASDIAKDVPMVLCAKGIERTTGRFMSQVASDILGKNHPISALSGPSFAIDVANGLPTAVTIAADDQHLAKQLAHVFSSSRFRCYASTDLIGVEIGGALKNVLALGAGVVMGRGLGASAQAALVTRGFAEIRRIATHFGAKAETMMGLCVLGDLILTASSPQSRNYLYGFALGAGQSLEGLPLAEGVATAPIAANLCRDYTIDAPIINVIAALLDKQISVDEAMDNLISRPLKFED